MDLNMKLKGLFYFKYLRKPWVHTAEVTHLDEESK